MDAINNFATLLQFLASVSIVFVAVEYARVYAQTLYERLFRFTEYLEYVYKDCILPDDNTIKGLTPITVGENNTELQIEEIKRDIEKIQKQIKEFQEEQMQKVQSICEAKSMSAMCFFFFLGCLFLLFLGSVESAYPEFAHKTTFIFCCLSYFVIVAGWLLGEAKCQCRWCNFTSLLHLFILFIICLILSLLVGWTIPLTAEHLQNITYIRWWVLLGYNILVVSNFVVFTIRIWYKIRKQKNEVSRKVQEEHSVKCNEIIDSVKEVKVAMKLASTTPLSQQQDNG